AASGLFKTIAPLADQELRLVREHGSTHPDKQAVPGLQIADDEAVLPGNAVAGDLDVPAGDQLIMGNEQITFRAADDKALGTDADDFTLGFAVIENGKEGQDRTDRWAVRARCFWCW